LGCEVTCFLLVCELVVCELTCGLVVCVLTRRLLVCVPPFFGAGVACVVVCACFFFFFFCWSSDCAACTDARPTNRTVTKVIKRFINFFPSLSFDIASLLFIQPRFFAKSAV